MIPSRPSRARRCAPSGAAPGYTIMELMITVTLAAFLLSLGIGAFLSVGKQTVYQQAMASVTGLVKQAQNSSSHVPAVLVIDPEARTITGLTERTLQELRFELRPRSGDEAPVWTGGIAGLDVQAPEGNVQEGIGRVGGGFRSDGDSIDCGNYAAFDVTEGFSAEVWMKPDEGSRVASDMIRKGGALTLHVGGKPGSEGTVKATIGVDDKGQRESISVTGRFPFPRAGEWLGVRAVYDRQELVVYTDDGYGPVRRGTVAESRPLRIESDAPLQVGDGGFVGVLDDFRFGGVHATEPVRIPDRVELLGKPRRIYFANGKLDPRVHQGMESVALKFEGVVTVIEIGPNGNVQDLRRTTGEPEQQGTEEELRPDQRKDE